MGTGYESNPFSSADRRYPVKMPFAINEAIYVNVTAPKGYIIDEFPKSIKVNFNEDEGFFEYRFLKVSDELIQMRSWLKLDRVNFEADEYQVLREFYATTSLGLLRIWAPRKKKGNKFMLGKATFYKQKKAELSSNNETNKNEHHSKKPAFIH